MEVELNENTQNSRLIGAIPTPVSPTFYIYDYWTSDIATAKRWDYVIPDDDMQYSICSFTHMANAAIWLGARVDINDVTVWMHISGFLHQWIPGYKSTVFVNPGDVISIYVTDLYAGTEYTFYWCLDFWRAPRE
jgi:hypothetical protein